MAVSCVQEKVAGRAPQESGGFLAVGEVARSEKAAVSHLLAARADVDAETLEAQTALHIAAAASHRAVVWVRISPPWGIRAYSFSGRCLAN